MSFKHGIRFLLSGLLCVFAAPVRADVKFDAPGAMNPIVPGYFADPTIRKFGDVYYLYATTDGNGGGKGPSQVWMSRDFVNWTLAPMNWPVSTDFYWAPDVVKAKDGRYYLYFNQPCITYGAVSDTPIGPWKALGGGDGMIIPNYLVPNVITLDAQTFTDKNGDMYMYWGTWGIYQNSGAGVGKLNPDMKSFSSLSKIPNTQAKDFFEAPYMIERNGVYYFMYSSGSCHDSTYRVQYAVSDKPDGEFKMGPNNPILATNADHTVDGPGHHGMLQEGDDYYIVYHRHDLPFTPDGMQRQVCADRMEFERDGVIKAIVPTHQGIGNLQPNTETSPNIAFTKKVTADSFYNDTLRKHEFKPEYAVDDNNATVWRPADNKMGHWLSVDLGSVQPVRRVATQFEYATWYYQYLLEYSTDGQNWKVFADRRQNTRWGSPMIDRGDVQARYLRLTVTGVEKPGLFGAVFNLKAYSQDRVDPLEIVADKAFADYVTPRQNQEGIKPWTATASPSAKPIISVDADKLPLGDSVAIWKNEGSIQGVFQSSDAAPSVGLVKGRKAVRFSGKEMLTASFATPRALSGNSSYTVSTWVNNPQIAQSECLVSWAGHNGPDAMTAQINYGSDPNFGAVGHWGFADMGFKGGAPKAGDWHHLAVVFDGCVERVYVDGVLNNAAAKLLLMHEGERMYLGASAPNTEQFDGYMASLQIYDRALSASDIGKLAQNAPKASALVQLDSARLDYGRLALWDNQGASDSAFVPSTTANAAPAVEDVAGRIAVCFKSGQSLESALGTGEKLDSFALVATLQSNSKGPKTPFEFSTTDGKTVSFSVNTPDSRWHQVIWVKNGATQTVYLDGKAVSSSRLPASLQLKTLRLGGKTFNGALSNVQLLYRPMTAGEVQDRFLQWQGEWKTPVTRFSYAPKALSAGMVVMNAASNSTNAGLQYLFSETSGQAGGSSSGWTSNTFFIDDELSAGARYTYGLKVRDMYGNVSVTPATASVQTQPQSLQSVSDNFETERDYLQQGVTGTFWSGYLGQKDLLESIASRGGSLQLKSHGSAWDGSPAYGPYLYQNVSGDFVVQVKVADYAGLSKRQPVGSTDGGLMVRLPQEGARNPENFVQLSFFPPWNQGNMVTNMLNGARMQKSNMSGFDADRYLQIIRFGNQFHFRLSRDGKNWTEMEQSPLERPDLANKPLQVGLFHATYGDQSSDIAFSDYRLSAAK